MTFDRRLAYELIASHLRTDGLRPRIDGDGLHIDAGDMVLRIRTDPERPPEEGGPAVLVWLDVVGADPRPMSFDLSGWGTTPSDQIADLAHGIVESVVPALRWLVGRGGPGVDARPFPGSEEWEVLVGRPWVVVIAYGDESPDALADDIRRSLTAGRDQLVQRLLGVLWPLTSSVEDRHWIKVYMAGGRTEPEGRIDVDNTTSWPGAALASSFTWASPTASQLVRQIIVMKRSSAPNDRTGGPTTAIRSRFGRLLGRMAR